MHDMKYLFAAGGTGGHVNPALAVAGYIREQEPDAQILFVGTAEKIEAKLVPAAGFDFKTIRISGFKRGFSPSDIKNNVQTVVRMFSATAESRRIIRAFQPDVAIGFGGYVSGPVIREAHKLGVKTVIHEQNAYPGVTNKTLAKVVDRVLLTDPAAEKYLACRNAPIVTGLPVRGQILSANRDLARFELGLDEKPLILSFGGSLGARSINRAVTELIAARHGTGACHFIHATGQNGLDMPDQLRERGVDLDREHHVDVRTYIDDMDRCLAAADLVICRAGASTISELEALGRASILVPYPHATENHQYYNALTLSDAGAAIVVKDQELTGELLIKKVDELLRDPNQLKRMGEQAKRAGIPNGRENIIQAFRELCEGGSV